MPDKLTIYVKPKTRVGGKPRKGQLVSSNRSEILHRRTVPDVLVNFVDMGQRWNGSAYEDITFKVEPTISGGFGPSVPDFGSTDWDSLKSTVYTYITNDGLDNFRPLGYTDAEKYGLDFYTGANLTTFDPDKYFPVARVGSRKWVKDQSTDITSNPNWTASGLKVRKGTSNFQLWSHTAFISPKSVNMRYKITSGDSYSDPSVPFTFNANCTIFLMPKVNSEWGWCQDGVGAHVYMLNLFYVIQPRVFFLPLDWNFSDGFGSYGDGTAFENSTSLNTHGLSPEESQQDSLLAYMKGRPTARVYRTSTNTLVSLSTFPQTSNHWDGGYTAAGSNPGITDGVAGIVPVPAGTLVAIIRKGASLFYVWYDYTTFTTSEVRFNNLGI